MNKQHFTTTNSKRYNKEVCVTCEDRNRGCCHSVTVDAKLMIRTKGDYFRIFPLSYCTDVSDIISSINNMKIYDIAYQMRS